jgi:AraC family transcriptional regulator of adaptative response/methylated-DNA-[protein]-cysteine methyltransferase
MTPKAYKDRGKGQKITYSTVACPLGFVLVAATKKGICAVRIGASKEVLATELEKEFKNAVINKNNVELLKWSQLLIDYISGTIPWPKLPYDVKATAFQRKIWDHLRTIPEGQTAHYGDIASAIGKPTAARAVARACAANPVALVVPCHRVLPKAGGVGGYRWGSKHKKRLLEMEKQKTQGLGPEGMPAR